MEGFVVVKKENWLKAKPDERAEMTYQTLENINDRLKVLESRRWFYSACATFGGMVGGSLTAAGIKMMDYLASLLSRFC